MEDLRRSTREPTYLHGVIYFNNGRDSMSCVIRDFSYEGARIVVFDAIRVPDEVELHVPEEIGSCTRPCAGDAVTNRAHFLGSAPRQRQGAICGLFARAYAALIGSIRLGSSGSAKIVELFADRFLPPWPRLHDLTDRIKVTSLGARPPARVRQLR